MPTTAVFDKLVFSFGFDIADIVPTILRVGLERQYYKIAPGQSVPVTLYIIDTNTTPNRRFMFTPAVGPFITIYSPSDTQYLAVTLMPQRETGVFTYTCQTATTDELGSYSAIFTATNGDEEMVSKKHHIFTMI